MNRKIEKVRKKQDDGKWYVNRVMPLRKSNMKPLESYD